MEKLTVLIGEASGYRDRLNKRNAMICNRYSAGHSIMEIAEEFYLSPETIKKLVYGKKVNLPMFSPTITSAENHTFSVPYQQEYLKFLKQEKRNAHYAFVFARNEEYGFFWNNFGKNFQR